MKYTKFRKKYKDLYEDLKEQMEKDIYNALQTLGYRGEKNHKDMMKFARKYKSNHAKCQAQCRRCYEAFKHLSRRTAKAFATAINLSSICCNKFV